MDIWRRNMCFFVKPPKPLIFTNREAQLQEVLDGLVVMISACQPQIASAGDLGSIPSQGAYSFFFLFLVIGQIK